MIEVTQEHIDQGKEHSCSECPVALALDDHWGPKFRVGSTLITSGNQCFRVGACLHQWIESFDAGTQVDPIKIGVFGSYGIDPILEIV